MTSDVPDEFPGTGDPQLLVLALQPTEFTNGTHRTIVVGPARQPMTISVPAGTVPGSTMRLPGLGTPPTPDGPPPDLLVRVDLSAEAPATGLPVTAAPVTAPPVTVPPVTGHNRRTPLIVAGVIALVLVLCVSPALLAWVAFNRWGSDSTAGPTTPGSARPSPTEVPLTAAAYQQLLTSVDENLSAGFTRIRAARTPTAVAEQTESVYQDTITAIASLQEVTPPPAAQRGHLELVSALADLGVELHSTSEVAAAHQICLGPAATALISRADAIGELGSAGAMLAAADSVAAYRFGSFLPKSTSDTNRRLANGAYLKRTSGGSGQLRLTNNGSRDTVISLVPARGGKATIQVYLRGKSSYTVTRVRDGNYRIYRTEGVDWDKSFKAFSRDCAFSRHDDTLDFTTTSTKYTVWTITLSASNGNTTASTVDPDDYPTG